MATKPKLQTTGKSSSSIKVGASASSSANKSPLYPKKDYSKKKKSEVGDFGNANFGNTGLTGES